MPLPTLSLLPVYTGNLVFFVRPDNPSIDKETIIIHHIGIRSALIESLMTPLKLAGQFYSIVPLLWGLLGNMAVARALGVVPYTPLTTNWCGV